MTKIRKAVFPVAGLGTRFLPATKAVPKEMMPVVDRPVLQYAVEEAKAAGVEHFIFVSSWGKSPMENHFDRHVELEAALERKGKTALLEATRDAAIPDGQLSIVRQHAPLGLGHAVLCARHVVGDEPFAVLLPDEVLRSDPPALAGMAELHAETGASVIAVMDVDRPATKNYGILEPESGDGAGEKIIHAKGMVEKPKPEEAPSTLACIGRYVLPAGIMTALQETKPGAGGEIQLTDAIAALIGSHGLSGWRFEGDRFDCGSVAGFLEAQIAFGMARPELRDDLTAAMRKHLGDG